MADYGQLLTFGSGDEIYGFDIMSVQDIIEIPEITPLPMVPEHIPGVMNLRGRVVPVVDFALKMGLAAAEYDSRSCIIVIDCAGSPLGVMAQSVMDAENYDRDAVIPSPVEGSCISGYAMIGGKRINVVDCSRMEEK